MNYYNLLQKSKKTKNKYSNKKITVDGLSFDSRKEARRYSELKMLEKSGLITELEMQKKFVLIPTQREPDSVGVRGGIIKGQCIEKECAYFADFVYKDENGEIIVEDTKGMRTTEYIIKRKLMLYVHGIRIVEK